MPVQASSTTTAKKSKKTAQIHLSLASKVSPQRQKLVRVLCKSFTRLADVSKSSAEYKNQREKWCDELLTLDGCKEDVDGLVGRGETLLVKEEFEEAVRTFERAFESSGRSDRDIHQRLQRAQKLLKQSKQKDYYKILDVSRDADAIPFLPSLEEAVRTFERAFESSGRSDRDIHQRLQRAHKLLKQSKQKDYYKILDVSRDADAKTIKKARKQAKKAHPDKDGSEAKMALLNEAYEVLSNHELRQRFDNGEDPMDPMSQQGGHPFAQFFQQGGPGGRGFPGGAGGFPGGQGGFQFHFSH
ncbi:chaperone J-domain-containing protein [Agrocybe pediades]|nr:chaperone J-domain-containing protein [Agrocybe pediades]